ncbi:MAG: homocysteine S-methyltransferase family protein [Pseudomonadota bacterium]
MIPTLPLPDRAVLLDGGMGRELRMRGVPILDTIWSANGLIVAPEVVRQVHLDYIEAGAEIVTTNSYGIIRTELAKEGIEHRFAELNRMAGALAREARERSGRKAFIAGSLPPLRGSYRPDLVGPFEEIEPLYEEQANLLAPFCDLILCETMSSAAEAVAAATAAAKTGLPVWVSWTLHEDNSGRLRSGESVSEAAKAIAHLPVSAFLVNCCAPESIAAAMPELARLPAPVGGYANAFKPMPEDWVMEEDGLLPLRDDLDPEAYAHHAHHWHEAGARILGGCCGTRPAHIARLRAMLEARP